MKQVLSFIPVSEFDRIRKLNAGPEERVALFADMCRLNTLSMIAYAGSGHIGSSFSSLDIVTWLLLEEMRDPDKAKHGDGDIYFSSKGHDAPGLYAAMIACGMLPERNLKQLRRLNGLPGHPDIETEHIAANTGSLGMGISKAKGMAFADKCLGRERRYFILTGDGELQEGQIWESLISAANHGLGSITVIVDHNKLQSDVLVSKTSDLGDLEAKFAAFGWHVQRCDGNDMGALASALDVAGKVLDQPQVIIADTVKGKGVSFMEATAMAADEPLYRFHSGAPSTQDYAKGVEELRDRINTALGSIGSNTLSLDEAEKPPVVQSGETQRLIPAYTEALVSAAEKDDRIVALDGDLVLDTGLIPFRERFPDRFLECGIAEMDMVSQAGGMALKGLLPVVHSFACFLSTRPVEQIYNNASEHTKVVYAGSLAGVLPGGPGHSHQAVNDIAMVGSMPGMLMAEPCCAEEVEPLLHHLLFEHEGSGYLRLVSIPCEIPYKLPENGKPVAGVGQELKAGRDGVIIGYGAVLLPQAWKAAEILKQQHGVELGIVNLPWLNRVDEDWLRETVAGRPIVVTLDNHLVEGGQGLRVGAALARLGLENAPKLLNIGLTRMPVCGQNDEVLRAHGLDTESLVERIAAQADCN